MSRQEGLSEARGQCLIGLRDGVLYQEGVFFLGWDSLSVFMNRLKALEQLLAYKWPECGVLWLHRFGRRVFTLSSHLDTDWFHVYTDWNSMTICNTQSLSKHLLREATLPSLVKPLRIEMLRVSLFKVHFAYLFHKVSNRPISLALSTLKIQGSNRVSPSN